MTAHPTPPPPMWRYQAYTHPAMVQVVDDEFRPEVALEIADDWKRIGETMRDLSVSFSVIITGSKEGWHGSAAEGAREALLKVGEFSRVAGDQFARTGEVVREQTYVADEAKAKMPPVVDYDPMKMISEAAHSGNPFKVLALPFAIRAQAEKADEARTQALDVLNARDEALHSATLAMPTLAEPPKVTRDQDVYGRYEVDQDPHTKHPVTPVEQAGTGTTTATANTPPPPAVPTDQGGTTRSSWFTPPTSTPPVPTPPPGLQQYTYQQQPPPGMAPPGALPPGRRPGSGSVVPPRGTPRVPPGGGPAVGAGGRNALGRAGGVPGTGMPGAAGGGAGVPGGGQRTPGFGPAGSAVSGPAGGAGRAGSPGAGGFGAAGAPGGQGQGGEDREHETKYLIPTDEYFDDTRMVAPETIGE
ncbi:MAG: hypothetical protein HOV94_34025 [Saccharothrix sp.]|nr:hypothetical protein [Saccharothrix sp.]